MKMTEELAAKILYYIENNQKLYNDSLFLYEYVFQGFENLKGDSFGNLIYRSKGWTGICRTEIFLDEIQMYYGESEEELVERLSKYAINYMACVVALDMIASKFKDQDFNVQHHIKSIGMEHDRWKNCWNFVLYEPDGKISTKEMYFKIEADDYKLVDKPLDLKLEIDVAKYDRPGLDPWRHIKVSELNKSKLEELMTVSGW